MFELKNRGLEKDAKHKNFGYKATKEEALWIEKRIQKLKLRNWADYVRHLIKGDLK